MLCRKWKCSCHARYSGGKTYETCDYREALQQLINQQNQSTLSDCIKEWEERGYVWEERSDFHNGHDYRCYFVYKKADTLYNARFVFNKYDNTYYAYEGFDTTDYEGYPITKMKPLSLDIDLHNLVTKTLKALEECNAN